MFDDEKETTTPEQVFTVGEKEYTQAQLNELVEMGEYAKDVETKFNTKLDRVVPDYTRASQEAAELRRWKEDQEKVQLEQRSTQGQLTQEDLIKKAKEEASKIGLMTDETTPALIRAEIEGYDLKNQTESLVSELSDMGIAADPKVILRYMDAAEKENPQDAVQELYGSQITKWQEAELEKTKGSGLYTESGSNAGANRLPPNVKITDDNLMEMFREAIGGND